MPELETTNVEKMGLQQLEEMADLLIAYSKSIEKVSINIKENPWKNVKLSSVITMEKKTLQGRVKQLFSTLNRLAEFIRILLEEQEINSTVSIHIIYQLKHLFYLISQCPSVPPQWLLQNQTEALFELVQQHKELTTCYIEQYQFLMEQYREEMLKLNGNEMAESMEKAWNKIEQWVPWSERQTYLAKRKEKIKRDIEIQNQLENIITYIHQLRMYGLELEENFDGIKKILPILSLLESELLPEPTWFDDQNLEDGRRLVSEFETHYHRINLLQSDILYSFQEGIFKIDYAGMRNRFENGYPSIIKIFNRGYKTDKRCIQDLLIDGQKKLDDEKILLVLNQLELFHKNKKWIEEHESEIQRFLGSQYKRETTNWNERKEALENFIKLKEKLGSFSKVLYEALIENKIKKEEILQIKNKLEEIKETPLEQELTQILGNHWDNLSEAVAVLEVLISETTKLDQIIDRIQSYALEQSNERSNIYFVEETIKKLCLIQKFGAHLLKNEQRLRKDYIEVLQGETIDWNWIAEQVRWAKEYKDSMKNIALTEKFLIQSCNDVAFQKKCGKTANVLEIMLTQMEQNWKWFEELFYGGTVFESQEIERLLQQIRQCTNIELLEEWVAYQKAYETCEESGLKGFLQESVQKKLSPMELKMLYLRHLEQMREELELKAEVKSKPEKEEGNRIKEKIDSRASEPELIEYEEADIWSIKKEEDTEQYYLHILSYIISVEAPIHFELLCKRIAPIFGNKKVTANVKTKVKTGVQILLKHRDSKVEQRGDFLWNADCQEVRPRKSEQGTDRKIQYIAAEELIEIIRLVLYKTGRIQKNALFTNVAKILGFGRVGTNIQTALQMVLDYMIQNQMIRMEQGSIETVCTQEEPYCDVG